MRIPALFGGKPSINIPSPHYVWPRITSDVESAVVRQLHTSVSIYDRSGIFLEFEEAFRKRIGRDLALVTNSGTSALYSAYEGIGLGPGDEVIVPSYTFFATVSPIVHFGAKIRQVDCRDDGNIDVELIAAQITPRTKAIVITHMWGKPCDTRTIYELAKAHGLFLIEDCSHAHGASIEGRQVGSYGDFAVWSLQGQKNVTGGEGGILLGDRSDIFERAVLLGQYNKRARQQVTQDSALYAFTTTGLGLKLRAHPLAIAMALEQLAHLDEWLAQKSRLARIFTERLARFPFLRLPRFSNGQHGWYAYAFNYDSDIAKVPLERFYQLAQAEGLLELDRPKSTGYISSYPLFTETHAALPRLYQEPALLNPEEQSKTAKSFYDSLLKLPMWAFTDEEVVAMEYINSLEELCVSVRERPEYLRQ